jgi:hypothetical protein
MDNDEAEGLRAFEIEVGAHAGALYPERPLWVQRDGVRREVVDVESQWREEERFGFRVRLTNGDRMLLYYVPELDIWSGVVFSARVAGGIVRRREEA